MFKKFQDQSVLFLLMLVLMTAGFSLNAHAEKTLGAEPEEYVQVRLIADKTTVQGGNSVRIGIEETIYPGWHTYWSNPGDSGTPTMIEWELPPGFSVSALEWPTPKKIPFGPLTNYGYEGQVTLLQTLTLPDDIGNTPFALKAEVNLLVCHEICIPESHDVFLTFNNNIAAEPERISAAETLLPTQKKWKTAFYEQGENFVLNINTAGENDLKEAQNIAIFPEEWGAIDNNANATLTPTETGVNLSQKIGERNFAEIPRFPVTIAYKTAEGINKSITVQANIKDKIVSANDHNTVGLWQALIFAIMGGLILNLMPCVFPVLSMKALSLINLGDKEEKKARAYGLSYTGGILISFAFIAGLLLALKAGGAEIGWGFQLQSPIVITFLAYLVFIIGLNLSGFFDFSGKLAGLGQKLTHGSGHRSAFFTGMLATAVATPCTAPFMGAAMGFALTQNAIISMSIFLALGFGLALPYLALCFIPPLRQCLPRPGHWMETFRQLLSFPMFITAAWLVWVLSQQIGSVQILCAMIALISIVFIIWLYNNTPEKGVSKVLARLLILLTASFILLAPFTFHHVDTATNMPIGEEQNWEEYSPQKLETYLNGNDPVFTNMTAAWCITCKVNEKIALKPQSTQNLFAEKNIHYLKGDWTNQNPDITQYLDSFSRNGVPLYVYYGARDAKTGERPEAVVLPQLLTPGLVKDTIMATP